MKKTKNKLKKLYIKGYCDVCNKVTEYVKRDVYKKTGFYICAGCYWKLKDKDIVEMLKNVL